MTNIDAQRIKEIRDNTAKMADAFTRIADALERLEARKTEPQTDVCDECIFVKGSGWCDNCNGKPKGLDALPKKTEPQTDCAWR